MTCINFCTVKNFYGFVEKLKHISLSHYSIISLDVKPLFNNVPIQVALNRLDIRLWEFQYFSTEIEKIIFSVSKLSHWFRCEDDTFVLVPFSSNFPNLQSSVNSIGRSIHFSFEVENGSSFSFLDILVSNECRSTTTTLLLC